MSDTAEGEVTPTAGAASLKVVAAPDGFRDHERDIGWIGLFNSHAFHRFHLGSHRGCYLTAINGANADLVGVAHFTERVSGTFKSPLRGTFGGLSTRSLGARGITEFVNAIPPLLQQCGAEAIEMDLRPAAHDPRTHAFTVNALLGAGFQITRHEVSFAMAVDGAPMIEHMARNNQKRLRKCHREGLVIEIAQDEARRRVAYNTIAENRAAHGYPISMSYEDLAAMDVALPGRLYFCIARHGDIAAAAAIAIRLDADVLYVFYWGDRPGYEQTSPVVLLAEHLYEHARTIGLRMLDLGTSTLQGVPNFGLIDFKERLGCVGSLKLSFACKLDAS